MGGGELAVNRVPIAAAASTATGEGAPMAPIIVLSTTSHVGNLVVQAVTGRGKDPHRIARCNKDLDFGDQTPPHGQ